MLNGDKIWHFQNFLESVQYGSHLFGNDVRSNPVSGRLADGKYVKIGCGLKLVHQCFHGKVARGARNSANRYFFEPKPLVMIPDR